MIITKDEILRTKVFNNNILYILAKFEGAAFEHLRSIKARLVLIILLITLIIYKEVLNLE